MKINKIINSQFAKWIIDGSLFDLRSAISISNHDKN